jgi:cell division protein FtsQ
MWWRAIANWAPGCNRWKLHDGRAVELSDRYAWTVKLSNGTTLELGREQGRELQRVRVQRLVAIWPQLASRLPNRIESIDMRYPNGLALKAQGLELKEPRKGQARVAVKRP